MKKIDRTGEENFNNAGRLMRIVEYHSSNNIIVEFQDEFRSRVKSQYKSFKIGEIRNPIDEKITTKIDRVGEEQISNQGCRMKIIKCVNAKNITVEFQDSHRAKVKTTYDRYKKGEVKNPFFKSFNNVGYIGYVYDDKKYTKTNSYKTWRAMIDRCYGKSYYTYDNVEVCGDWHSYHQFSLWFNENYYQINNEKMHLDKDIISKGNRIYSPENCVLVPQRINNLFVKANRIRGEYPIGVSYYDNAYVATCSNGNKVIHLGKYTTPEQAFYVYKEYKEKLIRQIADQYKDKIPKKLYDAMYCYEVEITD